MKLNCSLISVLGLFLVLVSRFICTLISILDANVLENSLPILIIGHLSSDVRWLGWAGYVSTHWQVAATPWHVEVQQCVQLTCSIT